MKTTNDISEELNGMGSSLAGMPHITPYSVPHGYFENFAGDTLRLAQELDHEDNMPTWGKSIPYSVPVNYFETLTEDIVAVSSTDIITAFLPSGLPLEVPVGYFESLPGQILASAKASDNVKKETKIIRLMPSRYLRSIKWAAAAILILSIGLGSYNILLRDQTTQPEQILASVSGNEIQDYLQHTYRLDMDRVVSSNDVNNIAVDNKDIIQYLDETGWDATE